jgi:hypothetical protein
LTFQPYRNHNFSYLCWSANRDAAGAVQGLREGGVTGQGSARGARDTCEDTAVGRGELHKAHSCMRTLRACPVQGMWPVRGHAAHCCGGCGAGGLAETHHRAGKWQGARDTCHAITVDSAGSHTHLSHVFARCALAPFRAYGPYGVTRRTDVAGAAQGLWRGGNAGQ